jgi:hypothetical protein
LALCWISVYAIKLPEHAVRKRSVISYRNWGEVSTEEFAGFLSQERRLTKEEKIENEIKQINEQNLFFRT